MIPKILNSFSFHGVKLTATGGEEYVGTCPFCHNDDHFYVNGESTQFDCKKCYITGNGSSFLTKFHEAKLAETNGLHYKKLHTLRGIPPKTLRRYKLAWDGERWLLPAFNHNNAIADLRCWKPKSKQILTTKGCKTQLFGLQNLMRKETRRGIVWLCEGEWDTMILDFLLRESGRIRDVVLGVPGAGTFKDGWIDYFRDRNVLLCYDNDDAGDKGSKKAGGIIAGVAASVKYLCWPDSKPTGWDIRDQVNGSTYGPLTTLNRIRGLLQPSHRRSKPEDNNISEGLPPPPKFKTIKNRPSIDRVLSVFRHWLDMDSEMIMALKVMLSVIISEQFPGSPLWMYIVGPAGAGKTLILCSAQKSDRVVYRSSIGPKTLISGFVGRKGAEDPSLVPKLHEKTLVLKDATEMLVQAQTQQDETNGIMRGLHDGTVSRSYGNNVHREYTVHTSVVAGVTNSIHAHPSACLGDRYLKFQFRAGEDVDVGKRVRAAIDNTLQEAEMEAELQDVVMKFLSFEVKQAPKFPNRIKDKLVPLCELVSILRANVERDKYTRELLYRPDREYGTRVAKQLEKLMLALAIVDGRKEINDADFSMARRVAGDTMIGFHLDIILAMNKDDRPLLNREISAIADVPETTCAGRLQDLLDLKAVKRKVLTERQRARVIRKRDRPGGTPAKFAYVLMPHMRRLLRVTGFVTSGRKRRSLPRRRRGPGKAGKCRVRPY